MISITRSSINHLNMVYTAYRVDGECDPFLILFFPIRALLNGGEFSSDISSTFSHSQTVHSHRGALNAYTMVVYYYCMHIRCVYIIIMYSRTRRSPVSCFFFFFSFLWLLENNSVGPVSRMPRYYIPLAPCAVLLRIMHRVFFVRVYACVFFFFPYSYKPY